jgi:NADPH-dependent 2,4-dienoyl-CoA reductase/sulfur reductase-like enzyme/nitrite reductase/ring-hydroxylating ferredoxin subunit
MAAEATQVSGPDLGQGIPASELREGAVLLGHVGEEPVCLVRKGGEVFALGAKCTHYGGPLAEGLFTGDSLRCPLHHARFCVRTGAVLAGPALDPIACWHVEQRGERLVVLGKKPPAARASVRQPVSQPGPIVILGGGAAGHVAAETLRNEGYEGKLTLLSADAAPPVDRPNLSKDYLAGTAPEEWIPLRPPEFYSERRIELVLGARATQIDVAGRRLLTESGAHPYNGLLIATGADPVRLGIPGAELPHVHYLRSLADSRAIIAKLGGAKRALVVGASFIGLEVAASLRARGVAVTVVAPEARPLERVLGPELGAFLRTLHEQQGVRFQLGHTLKSISPTGVVLDAGDSLDADLVVAGIGVRPVLNLAQAAGLNIDRGISVNEYLETSAPGIFAAGDVARWPDPHTGDRIRVEHWVVAERQGQIAARNLLGRKEPCNFVPFFWSQHYDVTVRYVGHAEAWDQLRIDGSLERRDARVSYVRGGKTLAVATVGRDRECLQAELELEQS